MMQDISTTLKGRIGSVPTMKHIKGDTCVTTFRLAIPRWRFTVDARTGNASYVEDGAYWYTIETWDKLADNVVRCCCKGDPVIVVARPVPNAWVDANGQIRSSIVFRASAVGHDMAKGTSRYTKNGAHSAQEPAAGSPDDPFSTRPGQGAQDERGSGRRGSPPRSWGSPIRRARPTRGERSPQEWVSQPACPSMRPALRPVSIGERRPLRVSPTSRLTRMTGAGPVSALAPSFTCTTGPRSSPRTRV